MILEIILTGLVIGLVIFGLWIGLSALNNKPLFKSNKYYRVYYNCKNCTSNEHIDIPLTNPLSIYIKGKNFICSNCKCVNTLTTIDLETTKQNYY